MLARTVAPPPRPHTPSTRGCRHGDCEAMTREGKPYCPDHVDVHPYVRNLLDALAGRRAEEERVRSAGADAVDMDGITAREVVLHLSLHGARTIERISRELQIDGEIVTGYVAALDERDLIVTSATNRGSTVVKLRDPERALGQICSFQSVA
jgi:hypothetical protein